MRPSSTSTPTRPPSFAGCGCGISEDPAYKNGTWLHPSIGGQDKFYYFDENDPIALSYKSTKDRISGSIEGTDTIGGTPVEVHLTFDLPIVLDEG